MSRRSIALFDVDGTLTEPRRAAEPSMLSFLRQLGKQMTIGIVGGSDVAKQQEQLGPDMFSTFDFVFSENGLVAYHYYRLIGNQSIKDYLGEKRLYQLINFSLHYIADLDIPVKRGTFVEFRNGMINISPIGRNCNAQERSEFEAFDRAHGVRAKMVATLEERFADFGLKYSIGGQISFDAFPAGWDKTYCLYYLDEFDEIHFFGDKVNPGGNDYEIFTHPRVIGHATTGPYETKSLCEAIFSCQFSTP